MPVIPDGGYIARAGDYRAGSVPRQVRPVTRVTTKGQLRELASELKVRGDWHEPDEQGVTAVVHGECLDNAGFWGTKQIRGRRTRRGPVYSGAGEELWAELFQDGEPVAEVNLANLLAWATAGDHGLT